MKRMACVLFAAAMAACGSNAATPPGPDAPIAPDAAPVDGGSAACAVPTVSITHSNDGATGQAIYHKVDTTVHQTALCNDGSAGVYTVRPGFGGGAHRWVIYIEGGGSCQTEEDCQSRLKSNPELMSSSSITDGSPNTTAFAAIRSSSPTDNPHFYDANFVQIEYCSSDGWTGATAATPGAPISNVSHWHFQGRAIIAAVIDDLLANGIAAGDEVLFTGGSAGAVGVYNNIDDVRAQLPASVRLVGVSDAGFILDYPAYDPATNTESTASPTFLEADAVVAAGVWGGHGNPGCEAAATTDTAKALCRAAPSALAGSFVHTPLFIRQSQLDHVQLDRLIPTDLQSQHGGPVDAYRGRFAAKMRDTLTALPDAVSPHYAEFSTFDMQHVMIDGPAWLTITVDNTPLEAAIAAFYQAPCTAPRDIQPPTQ
jgi:hypothetical protein